jgi:hypothetical protein
VIDLDRIEATRIRASNEAYDLRALTGNISRVIEEDLPAVVAELREARELLERLCDGLSAGHGWGEAYEEACEFLEVTE